MVTWVWIPLGLDPTGSRSHWVWIPLGLDPTGPASAWSGGGIWSNSAVSALPKVVHEARQANVRRGTRRVSMRSVGIETLGCCGIAAVESEIRLADESDEVAVIELKS